MNIRHLVTKGFSDDIQIKRSVVYHGTPITINLIEDINNSSKSTEEIDFNKKMPDELNVIDSLKEGKKSVIDSPIGEIVEQNGDILPLSSIYDFSVNRNSELSKVLPIGATFDDIFESPDVQGYMTGVAQKLFPNVNPNTHRADIDATRYYVPYIPLVSLTGCIPPQNEDSSAFFNPEGTLSIAEFLDSINSIKYGCNSNNHRKKTLDNISTESDYFNEGYQSCIRGAYSPFFNLYTREELLKPITRLELAYIIVICWEPFIEKFNNIYGGNYYLGVNFDWEVPDELLSDFEDGFDYKVSKVSIDDEYDVISLNIKDYKSDRTMTEYFEDIKNGVAPIPLPMYMSMIELHILDLFKYEDNRLDPLKEVSRGELSYFLSRLAKLFPTRYIKR
jgi:hypothetical protein